MGKLHITQRGESSVLPIVGDVVEEVRLRASRSPLIVFSHDSDGEAELTFGSAIVTLSRGKQEQILDGAQPGAAWNSRTFAPLVSLLGCRVIDAIAEKHGTLRLEFSENLLLTVVPQTYEGWHFRGPALCVTGADGRLIISGV